MLFSSLPLTFRFHFYDFSHLLGLERNILSRVQNICTPWVTWRSLMFGKGIPMVTTALALSSVKSRPSLTLPLQTAMRSAPSTIKKKTTFSIQNMEWRVIYCRTRETNKTWSVENYDSVSMCVAVHTSLDAVVLYYTKELFANLIVAQWRPSVSSE